MKRKLSEKQKENIGIAMKRYYSDPEHKKVFMEKMFSPEAKEKRRLGIKKIHENKKHFCNQCGEEVKDRLSKRWICRKCKRELENKYYHAVGFKNQQQRMKKYYIRNGEKIRARSKVSSRERNRMYRMIALDHYGGKCECCGENQIEFLAIDHINGGGNKHRKEIKMSIYEWLVKQNFPKEGFRILCHNCNQARAYYGYCPHQKI